MVDSFNPNVAGSGSAPGESIEMGDSKDFGKPTVRHHKHEHSATESIHADPIKDCGEETQKKTGKIRKLFSGLLNKTSESEPNKYPKSTLLKKLQGGTEEQLKKLQGGTEEQGGAEEQGGTKELSKAEIKAAIKYIKKDLKEGVKNNEGSFTSEDIKVLSQRINKLRGENKIFKLTTGKLLKKEVSKLGERQYVKDIAAMSLKDILGNIDKLTKDVNLSSGAKVEIRDILATKIGKEHSIAGATGKNLLSKLIESKNLSQLKVVCATFDKFGLDPFSPDEKGHTILHHALNSSSDKIRGEVLNMALHAKSGTDTNALNSDAKAYIKSLNKKDEVDQKVFLESTIKQVREVEVAASRVGETVNESLVKVLLDSEGQKSKVGEIATAQKINHPDANGGNLFEKAASDKDLFDQVTGSLVYGGVSKLQPDKNGHTIIFHGLQSKIPEIRKEAMKIALTEVASDPEALRSDFEKILKKMTNEEKRELLKLMFDVNINVKKGEGIINDVFVAEAKKIFGEKEYERLKNVGEVANAVGKACRDVKLNGEKPNSANLFELVCSEENNKGMSKAFEEFVKSMELSGLSCLEPDVNGHTILYHGLQSTDPKVRSACIKMTLEEQGNLGAIIADVRQLVVEMEDDKEKEQRLFMEVLDVCLTVGNEHDLEKNFLAITAKMHVGKKEYDRLTQLCEYANDLHDDYNDVNGSNLFQQACLKANNENDKDLFGELLNMISIQSKDNAMKSYDENEAIGTTKQVSGGIPQLQTDTHGHTLIYYGLTEDSDIQEKCMKLILEGPMDSAAQVAVMNDLGELLEKMRMAVPPNEENIGMVSANLKKYIERCERDKIGFKMPTNDTARMEIQNHFRAHGGVTWKQ